MPASVAFPFIDNSSTALCIIKNTICCSSISSDLPIYHKISTLYFNSRSSTTGIFNIIIVSRSSNWSDINISTNKSEFPIKY